MNTLKNKALRYAGGGVLLRKEDSTGKLLSSYLRQRGSEVA